VKAAVKSNGWRAAALTVWLAFLFLCVGNSVSTGLSYFDDAEMALVAQSLAHGTGYSVAPEADVAERAQFQPGISLGPALIVPCALILKVLGTKEVIPGLSAILTWGTVLTFLFFRVSRKVPAARLLAGTAVFCFSILAVFTWQFGAWYAFLGETTAAAFLLLGHWSLAMEKLSLRWLFLSGLCLGLALQTKYLAALGILGAIAILLFRWRYSRDETNPSLLLLATWVIAFLLPTILFECWKWRELGSYSYARNWTAFLEFSKSQGLVSGRRFSLVWERIAALQENYSVNLVAFALLLLLSLRLALTRLTQNWAWLFLGLQLSVLSLALYWIFFSIGLPRYLVIGMAMACFAMMVPVLGLSGLRGAAFYIALGAVVLVGGIIRIPATATRAADHGLFKATAERHARKKIVKAIRALKEPEPLVVGVVQRAEAFAIEFDLEQKVKFQRVDSLGNLPGKKFVITHHLLGIPNERAYIEDALHGPISSVILAAGPYELLTVDGPP